MNKVNLHKLTKRIIPPVLIDIYHNICKSGMSSPIRWTGNYKFWDEALLESSGYDSPIILEKVKEASLKVKNNEAIFERDSKLFYLEEYTWPLISWLLKISLEKGNKLTIIDFGGSLGSTYYQNRRFISSVKYLKWNIIEQQQFVNIGKEFFEDDTLKFYLSIDESLLTHDPDVILLSGVLQYLEEPYLLLKKLFHIGFTYIILDRTSFTNAKKDLLTIQHVPDEIYSAKYPCWFFNEETLKSLFSQSYNLEYSFPALDRSNLSNTFFKGFVFKRKQC